jgi:glutamate synthase (NADPH/NADH) small chain
VPDSLREVSYILEIGGIELRTGVKVGEDVSLAQLEAEFDAIFLGVGLGPDGLLNLPGAELEGITGAVALIERLKGEGGFSLSGVKRAAVIGGGNTAIDVVRELRGLGVEEVTLVYRRGEAGMSGYQHEWSGAKKEGVRGSFMSVPLGFRGQAGKVTGVRCLQTRLVVDEDGAERVEHVPGSEFLVPAELVVLAVGQSKLEGLLKAVPGLALDKGRVVVDPQTGQSGHARYFAGGDCANGGKEVVNAAAEGKKAARGIDQFLKNKGA